MNWATSDRLSRLPSNWAALRLDTFKRDGFRCTYKFPNGGRCPIKSDLECDHVVPGDDHRPVNLTTLCHKHHQIKSSKEGAAGRAKKRAEADTKFRRSEAHPGLL